jgi:hypothetical protein
LICRPFGLDLLRPGDQATIYRLGRLARSQLHLLQIIEEIEGKGAKLVSLMDNIDTGTATGKMVVGVLAVLAEFERNLLMARCAAGVKIARQRNVRFGTPIELWWQDEARVGQKNKIARRWARRGTRPRAPHDQRTSSVYIFGAICPQEGKGATLVLPRCDTQAMSPAPGGSRAGRRGRLDLPLPGSPEPAFASQTGEPADSRPGDRLEGSAASVRALSPADGSRQTPDRGHHRHCAGDGRLPVGHRSRG